jgi:RNA polymerase sigma factor (sigma-70 family)
MLYKRLKRGREWLRRRAGRDSGGFDMPANPSDDSAAIQEVLSGRTEAFRLLVERYFATVRLVALAKTGDLADAEDVAQETFIKAYETLGVLRNRERLAPWLVAIARNLAISLVRRRERERRRAGSLPSNPIIHPDHERRETLDAVARQVDALPENLREVVLLHYFEGLKCREIGERLDLNTNAVVKRLARGRDLLGDRLLREWAGERQPAAPSVHRVMSAIAALPCPDWTAQTAAMGGAGATLKVGGLTEAIFGPPVVFKVVASIAVVAVSALYIAFGASEWGDDATATVDSTTPVEEKSIVAVATSGASDLLERTLGNAEEEVVAIEIPPPLPEVEVGYVAGRVFDQDGQPMHNARLAARSYADSRLSGSATTNPNGEFRMNLTTRAEKRRGNQGATTVEVSCTMAGYSPVYQGGAINSSDMELVLLRSSALEGKVIDARTLQPIETFSWRISRPLDGDTWPGVGSRMYTTGWTDVHSPSGSFNIDDGHGIVAVSILADGYAGARVPVDVPLGSSLSGLEIPLEAGQMLLGTVFDKTTQLPMADVSVGVYADPNLAFFREHTRTDEHGRFSFRDMPTSASIILTTKHAGMGSVNLGLSPEEFSVPVEIFLGDGAQVSGVVRYDGGPPLQIEEGRYGVVYMRGASEGASKYGAGEIQADGSYIVSGLSDGWYTVDAWLRKGDNGREGQSVSRLLEVQGGVDVAFDIDGNSKGGQLEVALGALREKLPARFDLISMAVPEAVVRSQVEVGKARSNQDDIESRIEMLGIDPGTYILRASNPDQGTVYFEESVSVAEGEEIAITIDQSALQQDAETSETFEE